MAVGILDRKCQMAWMYFIGAIIMVTTAPETGNLKTIDRVTILVMEIVMMEGCHSSTAVCYELGASNLITHISIPYYPFSLPYHHYLIFTQNPIESSIFSSIYIPYDQYSSEESSLIPAPSIPNKNSNPS